MESNVNPNQHQERNIVGDMTAGSRTFRMKAVVTREAGGPDVLELQEKKIPVLQDNNVLIKVIATTVNKIDLIERKKHVDVGMIIGHECSGIIVRVGSNVTGWQVNDKVCALLVGNGYAEYASVPSNMVFPAPQNISAEVAASLPMPACTTFHTLLHCAILKEGKTLLIIDDSGEAGLFALQLTKALYKTRVFVVSDDDEKLRCYRHYGADKCFNRIHHPDYSLQVDLLTKKQGVNAILNYGGVDVMKCQQCLTLWGIMMVIFDVQDKRTAELSISDLRDSSSTIMVCDLRLLLTSTSERYLSMLVKEVKEKVWPMFDEGRIEVNKPMTMPLSMAADAHKLMEQGKVEKIVLTTEEKPQQEWNLTSMLASFFLRKRGPGEPTDSITNKTRKLE